MKTLIIMLMLLILSSCNTGPHYPPVGVWKSGYPNIILYFDSKYTFQNRPHNHLGIYTTTDDKKIKVFTSFLIKAPSFSIFDISALSEDGAINLNKRLFRGSFRVIDNQLHYSIGSRIIIFNRLTEYEPINPDDWFISDSDS